MTKITFLMANSLWGIQKINKTLKPINPIKQNLWFENYN